MCNRLLGLQYARMLSLLIIIGGRWPDLEPISTRNFPLITQTEYPQSNQPGGTFSLYLKKKIYDCTAAATIYLFRHGSRISPKHSSCSDRPR